MYTTVPQEHLDGRQIDFSRGIGLGGSSVINFAFWTTGPQADYDEWAAVVGDDSFNFENSKRLYRKIERQDVAGAGEGHSTDGAVDLHVSSDDEVEGAIMTVMNSIIESGIKRNDDTNSGDPIGVGLGPPKTSKAGRRVTAYSAYLADASENLTIKTNSLVSRILFEGHKAVGVVVGEDTCKIVNSC